jgi:methionyl-tRNA formyltransferase
MWNAGKLSSDSRRVGEMSLRIVFMGTPDFAVPTLVEIVGRGHEVVGVYTRAPKPGGRRGLDLTPSPIEREARRFALPVFTPATLRTTDAAGSVHALGADVAVVVAYGLILPKPILEACRLGAFNLHASLLPRWRGAAPVERAIMAGDRETGVTIHRTTAELDAGPIAAQRSFRIAPDDDAGAVYARAAPVAAELLEGVLADPSFTPQPEEGATYAEKIAPQDRVIDWNWPAGKIVDVVRGLSPHIGARAELEGRPVIVWRAGVEDGRAVPIEVQPEGRRRMSYDEFLRGVR